MNCAACGHRIEYDDALFCPNCAAPLEREAEPVEPAAVETQPAAASSVPFEDESRPFLERYWATLALSFSDPKKLFSNLPDGDVGAPIVYALITGTISAVFAVVWQTLLSGMMAFGGTDAFEAFAFSGFVNGLVLVLLPFFVVLGLFVTTAIYHVFLLMMGTRSRGFGVTLRAVAYAYGPNLLAIVPLCGGLVGGIWVLVLTILGAFYGHRTDAWRAVVAYFIPVVLCCGILMMFWFMIFGIAAAQGGL